MAKAQGDQMYSHLVFVPDGDRGAGGSIEARKSYSHIARELWIEEETCRKFYLNWGHRKIWRDECLCVRKIGGILICVDQYLVEISTPFKKKRRRT